MDTTIMEGTRSPVDIAIPDLDEKMQQAVLRTSLYEDAETVSEESMQVMLSSPLTTNGWDTVSICRVTALNKLIESKKTYPENIESTLEDGEDVYRLTGSFQPWSIALGGDGRNVNVHISLKSGTFTLKTDGSEKSYDVSGTSMKVQVKLSYFPQPAQKLEDSVYDLKVRTTTQDPDDPVASIITFTPPENLKKIVKAMLQELLSEWFNKAENLGKFDTLFSTVIINNMGSDQNFDWLKATAISYAYADANTEQSSIFGVLCMTNNRSCQDLPHQLPQAVLQEENNSVFLICREVFIKYQFMPTLKEAFPNSEESDFTVDSSGLTVSAANLKLDKVKYGAIEYQPVMRNFTVMFNETVITTTSVVDTNISPGIDATSTIITNQTLVKAVNNKGEDVMIYQNVGKPITNNQTHVDPGIIITEAIITLIGAIVVAVAYKVVESVVKKIIVTIIVAIVVAIVSIVVHAIIEKLVAEGVQENIPGIEPMVKAATKQIKWPFSVSGEFKLSDIKYNGAVCFLGVV